MFACRSLEATNTLIDTRLNDVVAVCLRGLLLYSLEFPGKIPELNKSFQHTQGLVMCRGRKFDWRPFMDRHKSPEILPAAII